MLDQDRGRILGIVGDVFGTPPDGARGFVQSRQGSLRSAGCANHHIADHQGGLGVSPVLEFPAQIGHQILRPDLFSVLRIDADQETLTANGEDAVTVHRGSHSRTVTPAIRVARPGWGAPQFLAARDIQRDQELLTIPKSHREQRTPRDRIARIAQPRVFEEPNPLGPLLRPLRQQALVRRMIPARFPPPLRPIRPPDRNHRHRPQGTSQPGSTNRHNSTSIKQPHPPSQTKINIK